jgi:hypothetical protein
MDGKTIMAKLISKRIIKLQKEIPVYDITVPSTSNFVLSNGIVVHNSKDRLDAVCGSVWSALQNLHITGTTTTEDYNKVLNHLSRRNPSTLTTNDFKSKMNKGLFEG